MNDYCTIHPNIKLPCKTCDNWAKRRNKAAEEGAEAFKQGKKYHQNPYKHIKDIEAAGWSSGWMMANYASNPGESSKNYVARNRGNKS